MVSGAPKVPCAINYSNQLEPGGVLTEPIRPGSNPDELLVFDHGFVRLDASMADDLSVVNSARVSFAVRHEEMDERDGGLIRFLMRDRHGCYDDKSEVLTKQGWKSWPEVTGEELFATRSPLGELEYQPALRVVHKEHKGHMIGFNGMSIDMLVTPNHNVLAAPTTTLPMRRSPVFDLMPARNVLWRSHRHTMTARWAGVASRSWQPEAGRFLPFLGFMKLVGFFIGDGHLGSANGLAFHIRKEREITYLHQIAAESRMEVRRWADSYVVPITTGMRKLFLSCYDENREKQIPRCLLDLNPQLLEALLDGLMNSDGTRTNRSVTSKWTYSTTSRKLADSIQELALKIGRSATIRPHNQTQGNGHYGTKPVWRVTIFQPRNTSPGLCRTRSEADNQMGIEEYNGNVHCVTVPNGTLYVRRNGYPIWSGNSPFEHNSFRFHIRTPIFVAREWFRHRIGCLAPDSKITFLDNGDQPFEKSIEDIVGDWNVDPISVRTRPLRVLNEATNEFGVGRVDSVFDKGVQPLFRIQLTDGRSLKATENHRLLTSEGWRTLRKAVGLVGEGPMAQPTRSPDLITNGNVLQDIALAKPTPVSSVEYLGPGKTYDLSVEGPWHNFVANGMVVHNSFNEESARYHKMADDFYVPDVEAVRSQVGKPGAYTFEPVEESLALETREALQDSYKKAFETYQDLSGRGVAKEVARSVLPVGIYTQFYWTINARSLMNFLSLRNAEAAQYEIRVYAQAIERFFQAKMPITHECFVELGRKAP